MDDSGLVQVERQRVELEKNISKLRKSLQHWQTWEIEYEGLREEIASLPDGSHRNQILSIARDFRADLVDEDELQTIVGREGQSTRTQGQIVDLLAKRVDYVSRNARTIEKQLLDAQKKRNSLLLAEEPDYRDAAALPLTDITEQLDDQGNVVSSKLETPDSTAPQLVDVLKKAGVKDLLEQDGVITSSNPASNGVVKPKHELPIEESILATTLSKAGGEPEENLAAHEYLSGTSLSQLNSQGNAPALGEESASAGYKNGSPIQDVNRPASNKTHSTSISAVDVSTDRTGQGNKDETVADSYPNDSPEEAALRREMLQYGLGEMGAIVAELELEDNQSDLSLDDVNETALSMESDSDEDDIDDVEGSEDDDGMIKRPALSRKYLKRMEELKQKHGINEMQNLGPDASKLPEEVQRQLDKPPAAEAARNAALAREVKAKDAPPRPIRPTEQVSVRTRKKVTFAEGLDIAPDSGTQTPLSTVPRKRPEPLSLIEPVKDSIVERQPSAASAATLPSLGQITARKPSKFRQAREATPQTPLLPPSPNFRIPKETSQDEPSIIMVSNKIHADNVIERNVTTRPKPPEVDDIDEAIHQKEIAGEYYKMRNRMIQRQGGFVGDGEADNYGEEITPLPMIDENGKEKKISRFKAARLKN